MPSYALPGGPVPALPVTLHNRRYCILVYSVLGEVISYALPGGPVPALTSDPAYPAMLYPSLFGPGRGY